MLGSRTPDEAANFTCVESMVAEYFPLSEKNASSAVTRLRRSEIIAVLYALLFVLANFGIAIAARMPMMTTTISSSIRVKPFRDRDIVSPLERKNSRCGQDRGSLLPHLERGIG